MDSQSCYRFIRSVVTWYEAYIACNGFPNTNMAEIVDFQEHFFLVNFIRVDSGIESFIFEGGL